MSARSVRRLLALLERERELLMAGDLAAASRLVPPKARLMDKIEADLPDAGQVAAIHRAAQRNQLLIEAAERGVTAARTRLRALRDGVGVNVYSAQGQRQMIRKPVTSLQKRA